MNKKNLEALIDRLRSMPSEQFDMSAWLRSTDGSKVARIVIVYNVRDMIDRARADHCGTTACLAGEIAVMGLAGPIFHGENFVNYGRRALGLDSRQAASLFTPLTDVVPDEDRISPGVEPRELPKGTESGDITIPMAVACLEILRDEGVVDWRRAIARAESGENAS